MRGYTNKLWQDEEQDEKDETQEEKEEERPKDKGKRKAVEDKLILIPLLM